MTRFALLVCASFACAPSHVAGPAGPAEPVTRPAPDPAEGPAPGDPGDAAPTVAEDRAASAPSSGIPADAQALVDLHNQVRATHCAPPLTWSPKLAAVAQRWAESLRDHGCAFDHSKGNYGENLAAGTIGYMGPKEVVAMWYGEIAQYSFAQPGFSMNTGHFTQVVWKGTTQLGCGHAQCNGNDLWVCEYDPPGNWDGAYPENVLPTTCKKSP